MSAVKTHLPMQGGYNFRDLGGLPVAGGQRVARGKLFRADSLGHLTTGDLDYLANIPIVTVVDFRSEAEAARTPDRLPSSVRHALHYPMQPGGLDPKDPDSDFGNDGGYAYMLQVNRELILNESIIASYRDFLSRVQQERYLPLLFHCSAGKDRTGLAAAFILLALGVDRTLVLEDYMASAIFLQGKYDGIMASNSDKTELFTVRPEFLQSALKAMEEKSGSLECYISGVLGVDVAAMRNLFLE